MIRKEVIRHIDEWEEAGAFARSMYDLFGELGFLGVGYPEDVGGSGVDLFDQIAMNEELMRSGSGGFAAGIGSLNIALPPIIGKGTAEQKERFVKPVLAGKRIAARGRHMATVIDATSARAISSPKSSFPGKVSKGGESKRSSSLLRSSEVMTIFGFFPTLST